MKKYTFLVFHRDYEPFLTQLRDLGVVHITQKAAGLIENDEALQAALQHEDELRRLLKQGAPDQLLQERAEIEQRIAEAKQSAAQVAVWGDFNIARVQALKDAGYTLRFFACSAYAYQEEWGVKVAEKEGKTYFVVVDNLISQNIDNSDLQEKATELPQPEKSETQYLQEVTGCLLLRMPVLRHGRWQTLSVWRTNSKRRISRLTGSVFSYRPISWRMVLSVSLRASVR